MLQCMLHEPFYVAGSLSDPTVNISVGWVSHAGSFCSSMPIWNETKDVCLIFSGEDFADRSDLSSLKLRGHCFNNDDASYLVHLYEERGLGFLEALNGWFSGIIVDLRKRCAVLFNDRYGLGRIYFHSGSNAFFFASEAKSLIAVLPELSQLDMVGLGEMFSCGCVLQNRTMFSGIGLLPPASQWIFSNGKGCRQVRYFSPEVLEQQKTISAGAAYEQLRETFPRILQKYYRSPPNVAISLTGGLDGRMIMSWARAEDRPSACYTFGGSYRDCADVRIARTVAKLCGKTHETIAVGEDFLRQFGGLAEKSVWVSDGTMDVTGAVEVYVNRKARQIAPVRVTGNYGSEILRRSIAFGPRKARWDEVMHPEFRQHVQKATETYTSERGEKALPFIAFKQVPWHHYSRLAVEQSQIVVRSPFLDNELVALAFRFPEPAASSAFALKLIADGNPSLARIPTDRGLVQRRQGLSAFRQCWHEFTFRAEYAYDYGMPQWLARLDHVLAPFHIERLFLGRHKFYHFRVWYRDQLADYVRAILLEPISLGRPYVDRRGLERIVLEHTAGLKNHTWQLHRLLTTELLQRQLGQLASTERN